MGGFTGGRENVHDCVNLAVVYSDLRMVVFSGRLYSEIFVELPSREDYPDYYEVIEHPTSLELIEVNIQTTCV